LSYDARLAHAAAGVDELAARTERMDALMRKLDAITGSGTAGAAAAAGDDDGDTFELDPAVREIMERAKAQGLLDGDDDD
jgi:hypothetical protein